MPNLGYIAPSARLSNHINTPLHGGLISAMTCPEPLPQSILFLQVASIFTLQKVPPITNLITVLINAYLWLAINFMSLASEVIYTRRQSKYTMTEHVGLGDSLARSRFKRAQYNRLLIHTNPLSFFSRASAH